ncbi:MAG: hypothetical protein HC821_02020 [Lewinella sp.]|nr:hypothetical protein [Lewinella sp.]
MREKTNTADIRSATFIDLIYGLMLMTFRGEAVPLLDWQVPWAGNLPMSTTWLFVGLLAGRELGIQLRIKGSTNDNLMRTIFSDLGKVFFGLIVSIILVFMIKLFAAN